MYQVRGQFDVKLDAKGRLPLPVRLREKLKEHGDTSLVLAAWDGGLQGFTVARWTRMEQRFSGVSLFDRRSRDFLLAYVASASEVELDAQGRIRVPPALRRRSGLEREAVVVSYLGLLEIWAEDRWASRHAEAVREVELHGPPEGLGMFDVDAELGE